MGTTLMAWIWKCSSYTNGCLLSLGINLTVCCETHAQPLTANKYVSILYTHDITLLSYVSQKLFGIFHGCGLLKHT